MFFLIISISIQAFFSPGGGARNAIIRELSSARINIDVAMYILTDRELSNALASAERRGVKVRAVMDGSEARKTNYSKHFFLDKKGVDVRLDKTHKATKGKYPGIMHNKFAIIDGEVLITGSYNWTHSAEVLNDENLLIIKGDKELIQEFEKEFLKIWKRSTSPGEVLTLDPYNTSELRQHIGEGVVIVGKPSHWNISGSGHLFLDFGRGKGAFTFLLWKEGVRELKKKGFDFEKLSEDSVELTGILIDHEKYGLEIVTDDPDAIQIK